MWEDSVGVGESALWIFSVFHSVFHCSTLGCQWHPTFSCHTFSCHWGTIEILFSLFKVTHGMFWRWGSFRVNTAWRSTWQSGEFHLFDSVTPPPLPLKNLSYVLAFQPHVVYSCLCKGSEKGPSQVKESFRQFSYLFIKVSYFCANIW